MVAARNDSGTAMADDLKRISAMISAEIGAKPEQAAAAIKLLDEGSTVPFIARYRKEATGGLDDTQFASSPSGWSICANSTRAAPRFSNRSAPKAS